MSTDRFHILGLFRCDNNNIFLQTDILAIARDPNVSKVLRSTGKSINLITKAEASSKHGFSSMFSSLGLIVASRSFLLCLSFITGNFKQPLAKIRHKQKQRTYKEKHNHNYTCTNTQILTRQKVNQDSMTYGYVGM